MKYRKYAWLVGMKGFWFQKGKPIPDSEVDFSKRCSSDKSFRTLKKVLSFLNGVKNNYPPDTEMSVYDINNHTEYRFRIGE